MKETASKIAPLFTHLFQQSLNSGEVPMAWRQAYISPIVKKGDRSDPKNYCPVSLTSIVCKTMEHVHISKSDNASLRNKLHFSRNSIWFQS